MPQKTCVDMAEIDGMANPWNNKAEQPTGSTHGEKICNGNIYLIKIQGP